MNSLGMLSEIQYVNLTQNVSVTNHIKGPEYLAGVTLKKKHAMVKIRSRKCILKDLEEIYDGIIL